MTERRYGTGRPDGSRRNARPEVRSDVASRSGTAVTARSLAAQGLRDVLENGEKSHVVLASMYRDGEELTDADRRLMTRLFEGTLERLLLLDHLLDRVCSRPVSRQKPYLRTVMRMTAYQLCFLDSVPPYAAVSEALRLLEQHGLSGLKGFANGCLRSLQRQKEELLEAAERTEGPEGMSLRTSAPKWLCERLTASYGADRAQAVLSASLTRPPVTGRLVCPDPEAVLASWEKQGIGYNRLEGLPDAYEIGGFERLDRLAEIRNGSFLVQDVSSMLAVLSAGIRPGMTVMDPCAAPGGKSLLAARLLDGSGRVISGDKSEAKLRLLRENVRRAGMEEQIACRVWDASVPDPALAGQADVLLLDVPCSGLGVLRRKKEIKYRVTPESAAELIGLQRQIAAACLERVRPGGQVVYSTCTVLPEENIRQREWLLDRFPLRPVPFSDRIPERFRRESTQEGWLQLLPGIDETDGFFIAVFEKEKA